MFENIQPYVLKNKREKNSQYTQEKHKNRTS